MYILGGGVSVFAVSGVNVLGCSDVTWIPLVEEKNYPDTFFTFSSRGRVMFLAPLTEEAGH
jgi:hypothetical protein